MFELKPGTKEKYLANRREKYKKDPAKYRRSALLWRYNITHEEYEALETKQQGFCAICKLVPEGKLFVDHDHDTGAVRALLCNTCNFGLGQFQDSPDLLLKAYNYLKEHKG